MSTGKQGEENKQQQGQQQQGQQQGQQQQGSRPKSQQHKRTTAEWVTLGVSAVIILGLVGLITYLAFRPGSDDANLQVQTYPDQIRTEQGFYYLPVKISNLGNRTVGNVWIEFALSTGQGQTERSQISMNFLSAQDSQRGQVAFQHDPSQGSLKISFGYIYP